ncbi:MAG TPA: chemotaxis protein CheW [Thermoanaerobaculia bacterium]
MTLPRRDRRAVAAPVSTFVVFTAAGRRFALATRQVVAVAETPPLNPLPSAGRPEVLGLVAHRGRALPLVDLGRRLDGIAVDSPGPHCLVVEDGGRRVALGVAELVGLQRVSGDGLPPGCDAFDPAQAVFAAGREDEP